jgi:hypothetical protein
VFTRLNTTGVLQQRITEKIRGTNAFLERSLQTPLTGDWIGDTPTVIPHLSTWVAEGSYYNNLTHLLDWTATPPFYRPISEFTPQQLEGNQLSFSQ